MKYANSRYFVAAERDSDLRIKKYRWLEGYETDQLPHYYDVWQCPQCNFADFVSSIEDPKGVKENYIREAFKDISGEAMGMLGRLRDLVPHGNLDFSGAVAQHLAALFIVSRPNDEKKDHNKLGRLNLRLAWLFRERSTDDGGETLANLRAKALVFTELAEALQGESAAFQELSERRVEERKKLGIVINPYTTVSKALTNKISELVSLASMLQRAVITDANSVAQAAGANAEHASSKLDLALIDFKKGWPEAPTNEYEALSASVREFEISFKTEPIYKTVEQGLAVIALTVELYRRIGNYAKTLDTISALVRGDIRLKDLASVQQKLARAITSASPESLVQGQKSGIDRAIIQMGITRRATLDSLIEEKKEIIEKIVGDQDMSVEQKTAALNRAEVSGYVIHDLRDRGVLKESKKKGIFG